MRSISRHDIAVAPAQRRSSVLSQMIPNTIAQIATQPAALETVMLQSLEDTACRSVWDRTSEDIETWNSMARAMQASSAVFVAASQTGGHVCFRINDELATTPGAGPTSGCRASNWVTALYLAMICRERPRSEELAAVPVAALRASGVPTDEFMFSWVRAWQTYWRQEPGFLDLVVETMKGLDPAVVQHVAPDAATHIYLPPVEMLLHLAQQDETAFNDTLAQALALHHRYWVANDSAKAAPAGFIALGPLAVACLAQDAGMNVTVRSDYVPAHLLAGSRVGQLTL